MRQTRLPEVIRVIFPFAVRLERPGRPSSSRIWWIEQGIEPGRLCKWPGNGVFVCTAAHTVAIVWGQRDPGPDGRFRIAVHEYPLRRGEAVNMRFP